MKISNLILCLLAAHTMSAQPSVDIDQLISSMSLEEKVGQMCQVDLGVVAKGDICQLKIPQQIDKEKLRRAIEKYQVGSILNVGCGAGAMTLDQWRSILLEIETTNQTYQKHNIPIIYGIDAIHGAGYTLGSILLPQQLAQAATWNPELVQRGYEMTAYETRASGLPWNFSPVLDLGRQPLWSRFFETFGEDIHLAKSMTTAAIQGLQGEDISDPYRLAACMKHFLGYSNPISGKDRTPVYMSDLTLREYYLPTFQRAIALGAATVMINSGEIDGIPVHANKDILTGLLRDELGFEGVAVTDWEDIWKLVNFHHVAATKKEAVKMAIDAGIDMSMVPNDMEFCDLLIALVKEGSISMERIDLSVRRILQLKKNLGLFEHFTYPKEKYPDFGSYKHKDISYLTAAESITLLLNENNTLPLQEKDKVLFCGPGADAPIYLLGAWSRSWQGIDSDLPEESIWDVATVEMNAEILQWNENSASSPTTLATLSKDAKAIIICLAEKPSTELPGNSHSIELPESQKALVREMKALGKKVILVCNFNRPLIITEEVEMADAVVYAYQPGTMGATAIVDVLLGRISPSGKLPFTYPKYINTLVHYDRKHSEEMAPDFTNTAYDPLFDFGHGLSYSTFSYGALHLDQKNFKIEDSIRIDIDIKNTGTRDAKEVVQVYYSDEVASVTPSVRRLCGYQKVKIKSGETKKVTISIPVSELSFVGRDLQRVVEPGDFIINVNGQTKKIHVQ